MKTRIFALILVMTCILAVVSCSKQDGESVTAISAVDTANTTTASEDGRDTDDLPNDLDLQGFTVRVLSPMLSDNYVIDGIFYVEEQTGDVLTDSIYIRNSSVCGKYNFSIDVIYASSIEGSFIDNAVYADIMADAGDYDIALPYLSNAALRISDGLYLDLNDVPYIDLDKNYYDQNFIRDLSLGGKLYFVDSDILIANKDSTTVTMFNKSLSEDLNLGNLYDVVNSGAWTCDAMLGYIKIANGDTNGDGVFNTDDTVGHLYASNNCLAPYLASGGFAYFTKDSSDLPQINTDTEKLFNILGTVQSLLSSDISFDWLYINDAVSTMKTMHNDKRLLFQSLSVSVPRRLYRDLDIDFGFLPVPKITETQQEYLSTVWKGHTTICVPSSNRHTGETGAVIEALASASQDIAEAYYKTCVKYAQDQESLDMIDLALSNVSYDIGAVYDFGGLPSAMITCVVDQKFNFNSTYASYSDAADSACEDYLDKLSIYMGS